MVWERVFLGGGGGVCVCVCVCVCGSLNLWIDRPALRKENKMEDSFFLLHFEKRIKSTPLVKPSHPFRKTIFWSEVNTRSDTHTNTHTPHTHTHTHTTHTPHTSINHLGIDKRTWVIQMSYRLTIKCKQIVSWWRFRVFLLNCTIWDRSLVIFGHLS